MGQLTYAAITETRPREVLRELRCTDDAQELWGEPNTRGYGPIPQPPELLTELWQHEEDRDEGHSSLAGKEVQNEQVLQVFGNLGFARPPHRPKPHEQRPDESDNAVQFVSLETALAGGQDGTDGWGPESAGDCGCPLWGQYAPAIHRWEMVLGRAAPAPTQLGPKGLPRLSARAVEWLMGLPPGWVTDVPGLNRNAQLKALGNGVVPAQAEAALRYMLAAQEAAA